MNPASGDVEKYWTVPCLEEAIVEALRQMGKDGEALDPADLAPIDELHFRGREATRELARRAGIRPEWRVLDVGCGLGGSARYLAFEYGCRVTGIDLSGDFCRIAAMLSTRTGFSDRTVFHQGNALAMPFADDAFDMVWTEHAQMNIADKEALYGEMARVLRPGGKLVFHDILQGTGGALRFPVPWAVDPAISHLIPPEDLRHLLTRLGFRLISWQDVSAQSLAWFRQARERGARQPPPPLGPHLLHGDRVSAMRENLETNLAEQRMVLVQGVFEKRAYPASS